jgi:hypothetical protein
MKRRKSRLRLHQGDAASKSAENVLLLSQRLRTRKTKNHHLLLGETAQSPQGVIYPLLPRRTNLRKRMKTRMYLHRLHLGAGRTDCHINLQSMNMRMRTRLRRRHHLQGESIPSTESKCHIKLQMWTKRWKSHLPLPLQGEAVRTLAKGAYPRTILVRGPVIHCPQFRLTAIKSLHNVICYLHKLLVTCTISHIPGYIHSV